MKLLIVSQYFWPESFIINDLVRALRAQGHEVVVATGKPNYPGGEIFPGYRASGTLRESFAEGVEVVRAPLRPRRAGGGVNLIRNYLSFVWQGSWQLPRMLRGKRFDAILAYCPSPITSAIPAIVLKRRFRAPLAIWVQDLWPESLEATGFVRSRLLLSVVGMLVRAIYATSDLLLVQSRAFAAPVARYAPRKPIVYYPNSIPVPDGSASGSLPPDLEELLAANFCVVFAGNIGTAQAMGTIIDAAAYLSDLPDVRLVLAGSGSRAEWVETEVSTRGLSNVVLTGRLASESMGALYRGAQGLLVTLSRHEIFSFTVPSKVQGYLAAGRPIIAALDGEGARVVAEADAGLTCPAEDAEGLASCIRALHAMSPQQRSRLGDNGRKYFGDHFELTRQTERLVEILKTAITTREHIKG